MSDITPTMNTVSVSRKIADGNYGSREVTFFAQFPGSITEDPKAFEAQADLAINALSGIVNKHLGIDWELTDAGVVIEKAFSGQLAQGPAKSETKPSGGGSWNKPKAVPSAPTSGGADVTLGTSPETGEPVVVKSGQYGLYVTDGRKFGGKGVNASLPKGQSASDLTLDQAMTLIAERVEYMKNKAA